MLPYWTSAQSQLVVEANNGTRTVFLLADKPVITFDEENLKITSSGTSTDFVLAHVAKFYFEAEGTGMDEVLRDADCVLKYVNQHILSVYNVSGVVSLFDLSGKCCRVSSAQQDGAQVIDLSGLSEGVYLLHISHQTTIKIYYNK